MYFKRNIILTKDWIYHFYAIKSLCNAITIFLQTKYLVLKKSFHLNIFVI